MRGSMKTVVVAIAAASVAFAAPSNAQLQSNDAAKLIEARAIIEVMFPPAQREQIMDKILTNIEAQMRPAVLHDAAMSDPGLKAILDSYADKVLTLERPVLRKHIPDIMEANAIAYTHEFSLAELRDIHTFAGSASGRHYLTRASAIIGDPTVAKVNMELAAEAQATAKTTLPEFREKLVAYLKAHPDVAAKVKSQ